MRYRIVSDYPGRIRVRFGGYAFDKSLESCIQKVTEANPFILSAEVHYANGGLLICYKKDRRHDVISKALISAPLPLCLRIRQQMK